MSPTSVEAGGNGESPLPPPYITVKKVVVTRAGHLRE